MAGKRSGELKGDRSRIAQTGKFARRPSLFIALMGSTAKAAEERAAFKRALKMIYYKWQKEWKMKKLLLAFLSLLFIPGIQAQDKASGAQVGSQTWMTKNLDVTTYRNGDIIPEVKDAATWAKLKTGAWCYYDNDPANGKVYGKLYNWYAVNDPRGLAPEGWHVPTDEEWNTLTKTLGGEEIAGGKMKEMGTKHWETPNAGATNSSGFTGLPGGIRFDGGNYSLALAIEPSGRVLQKAFLPISSTATCSSAQAT